MAKGSEARRKKRLEKKRARRKEKLKQKHRKEYIPLRECPLHGAFINPDWEGSRLARILLSRRHPDGSYVAVDFLVDLDGFGLRDCSSVRRTTLEALENFIEREKRVPIDAAVASALVQEGVRWANRYRFPLPKEARKALELLPPPARCPVEFGRDGEPYLRGDEADIRRRVQAAGYQVEDFECELFPSRRAEQVLYFVSEDYLRQADRNDPLVRLERLASLADRYAAEGQIEKAEELHSTMEQLAGQCNRLADFLRYLAQFQQRQERMEQALKTYERIVEISEEGEPKALARLDLADYMRYLGDALGADEIYQKVLAQFPDFLEAHLRYARFLYNAARREEGKQKYREIIEKLADRTEASEYLRKAYQELYSILKAEGAKSEAKALYKEAKKRHRMSLS